MTKARTHLLGSFLFLLAAIALYCNITPVEQPRVEPVPVPAQTAPVSALTVEGVWEQYALEGDSRYFMARMEIRRDGASYIVFPLCLSEFTYPKHAYRSFEHVEEDGTWSFKEDWDGEIGRFVLERQPNGEYVGYATSLLDGSSFKTVFVRVGD